MTSEPLETDAFRRVPSPAMAALPDHSAMQRGWAGRTDIMATHPGNEPVAVPLVPLFHRA